MKLHFNNIVKHFEIYFLSNVILKENDFIILVFLHGHNNQTRERE